jgi:hypothetical protein
MIFGGQPKSLGQGNKVGIGCDHAELIGLGPLEYDDVVGPLKTKPPHMCHAGKAGRAD